MKERIDNTGFGDIRVIQNPGLGYGVDSVLLAAFAAGETGAKGIESGARVADLGSGSGIVGFIITHKVQASRVIGIEKRGNAVDRSSRAAEMNGLQDRISFVAADVKEIAEHRGGNSLASRLGTFDAVVSNPPYFRLSSGVPCMLDDKYIARHETSADIRDFTRAMANLLDKGGDCYIVHRPDRLADIFEAMRRSGIEPKTMQMVVPRNGEAANIVLIHGIKGGGKELKLLPEIAVHNQDGTYTDVIESLYERRTICLQ